MFRDPDAARAFLACFIAVCVVLVFLLYLARRWLCRGLYWTGVFLAITTAGMLLGIVLGALIWVTVGTLAGAERTAGELLRDGADIGMRYARVWAGGIAFILCFVKAHEKFSFRAWCRRRFRGARR